MTTKNLYCEKQYILDETTDKAFTKRQLLEIRKRTPQSEIETKEDETGFKYRTVKGSYMKKKMNIIFGWNYDFQIISREHYSASKEVLVLGRLTIRSGSNTIIKEQFGKHYLQSKTTTSGNRTTSAAANIGNGFKSAATDAFKKCASEIGLCWDVYTNEAPEGEKQPEMNHQDTKVYERLEHFLSKCDTVEALEETFENFERETNNITDEQKLLLAKHMRRVLTK